MAGDSHGHARVWSLAESALRCELPERAGLSAAAFDPTGERFAVADEQGAVLLMWAGATAAVDLPLGWLKGKEAEVKVATGRSSAGELLKDVSAKLVTTRQISVDSNRVEGVGADRKLVISVFFGHDADSLRVGLHYPAGDRTAPPRPELFKRIGGRAGYSTEVVVPLRGVGSGKYRVVVQPCGPRKACGNEPPREFALDL